MKKIIKVTILLTTMVIMLVGCGGYKRDTSAGTLTEVTLEQGLKLAKEESETIVLFTLSTCKDCIKFKEILKPYLENHSVEINEVVLDNEGNSDEEVQINRKKIKGIFSAFNAVPSMFYMKDGVVIDELVEASTEEVLEDWVVKNKVDKK